MVSTSGGLSKATRNKTNIWLIRKFIIRINSNNVEIHRLINAFVFLQK